MAQSSAAAATAPSPLRSCCCSRRCKHPHLSSTSHDCSTSQTRFCCPLSPRYDASWSSRLKWSPGKFGVWGGNPLCADLWRGGALALRKGGWAFKVRWLPKGQLAAHDVARLAQALLAAFIAPPFHSVASSLETWTASGLCPLLPVRQKLN